MGFRTPRTPTELDIVRAWDYPGRMDLDDAAIMGKLAPFRLDLSANQLAQLSRYLRLLLRWNRAINLTSIREPTEIVTRHFGESMYLAKFAALRGILLDVGSGAGFPGLALKIAVPELSVVLLEPVAKKRAFLKEVARDCGLTGVDVRSERVDEFGAARPASADAVTMRAVGSFHTVLKAVSKCLAPEGVLYLWLTHPEARRLAAENSDFGRLEWSEPIRLPLGRQREIWCGRASFT